jgi:hypothetical protein
MARPSWSGRTRSIRVTCEGRQWVARCRFRQLNGGDRPRRAMDVFQDPRMS